MKFNLKALYLIIIYFIIIINKVIIIIYNIYNKLNKLIFNILFNLTLNFNYKIVFLILS
jgi:hypothetical protein